MPNPNEARSLANLSPQQRQRPILGSTWTVPAERSKYPRTLAQQESAPWPWQVEEALGDLLNASRPTHWVGEPPGRGSDREQRWLAAAMTMPWKTDVEAGLFVEATQICSHFKTMAVMGRWRQIALNPAMPNAAVAVVAGLPAAMRLWDDPRSQAIGQVITLDLLRAAPNKDLKERAAYGLQSMREVFSGGKDMKRPEPSTSIVAVSKMAMDANNGDAWTRLYVYAYSACEALDNSPIQVNRRMDPNSPEVQARLSTFNQWVAANAGMLAAAADREKADLEAVRAAMRK